MQIVQHVIFDHTLTLQEIFRRGGTLRLDGTEADPLLIVQHDNAQVRVLVITVAPLPDPVCDHVGRKDDEEERGGSADESETGETTKRNSCTFG